MEDFVEIGEKARFDAEKRHELEELRGEFMRPVPKEYRQIIENARFQGSPGTSAMSSCIDTVFKETTTHEDMAYGEHRRESRDNEEKFNWEQWKSNLSTLLTPVGRLLGQHMQNSEFINLCMGHNRQGQIIAPALGAKRYVGVDEISLWGLRRYQMMVVLIY